MYPLTIDGEVFIGRTVPGSARLRLYHQEKNQFIAAFDPEVETLLSAQPSGRWSEVGFGVAEDFLKILEPDVLAACRTRYLWFRKAT